MNNHHKNLKHLKEQGWLNLKTRLDEEMPIQTFSKRRTKWFIWIFLPGFLICGVISMYLLNSIHVINKKENSGVVTIPFKSDAILKQKNSFQRSQADENSTNRLNPNGVVSTPEQNRSGLKSGRIVSPSQKSASAFKLQHSILKSPLLITNKSMDEQNKISYEIVQSAYESALHVDRVPIKNAGVSSNINNFPLSILYLQSAAQKQPHVAKSWRFSAGPQFSYQAQTSSAGAGLSIQIQRNISSSWSLSADLSYSRYPKKKIVSNDLNAREKINRELESFSLDSRGFIANSRSETDEWNINTSICYHIRPALQISAGLGYVVDLFRYYGTYIDPNTSLPGSISEELKLKTHKFELHVGFNYQLHPKWSLDSKIYPLESSAYLNENIQFKNQYTIGLNYSF